MIPLERKGWKNSGWGKETYFFPVNQGYASSSTDLVYLPMGGSQSEQTTPGAATVQFIPPNSGRLHSLTLYSDSGTAPGSTVITLYDNNASAVLATKTVTIPSQSVLNVDFTQGLDSGNPRFDGVGSVAIGLDVTNGVGNLDFEAVFEVDK